MVKNGVDSRWGDFAVTTPAFRGHSGPKLSAPSAAASSSEPQATVCHRMAPQEPSSSSSLGLVRPTPLPAPANPLTIDPDDLPLSLLVPLRGPVQEVDGSSHGLSPEDLALWERDDWWWGHDIPRTKRSSAWVHILPLRLAKVGLCRRTLNDRAQRGAGLRNALPLGRILCQRCIDVFRERLNSGGVQ